MSWETAVCACFLLCPPSPLPLSHSCRLVTAWCRGQHRALRLAAATAPSSGDQALCCGRKKSSTFPVWAAGHTLGCAQALNRGLDAGLPVWPSQDERI